MPYHEKMVQVEHIIDVLELRQCLNTRIGDEMKRGLSKGEKKRTSIACELLTNPTTMLLDEPTSGLDSGAALSLMSILKNCARKEHKSVVVTVHQPSSQIFHMFDRLLLLTDGQVAFFGPTRGIFEFFCEVGLHMTPHYNPADFIIEQVRKNPEIRDKLIKAAPNFSELKEVCGTIERISSISGLSHLTDPTEDIGDSGVSSSSDAYSSVFSSEVYLPEEVEKWPTCFWTQLKVLSRRKFQEAHGRMLSSLNWIQTIGLGLVSGLLWFQMERTETNLSDIQGWMFFSITYWMLFALFGALTSFPLEREVVNKERESGTYRLSAYCLAKMIGEFPLTVTLPSVFHFISYSMLGLHDPQTFLCLWGFLFLNTVVAQSAGILVGALCVDLEVSVTVSALYSLSTMLFGGFYAKSIPSWLLWLKYFSMVHYAVNNMQIIEFGGSSPIRCAPQNSQFELCRHGNNSVIPVEVIIEHQGMVLPLWANTKFQMFNLSGSHGVSKCTNM
ncbi:ABC transporter G family member 21-like isoform X1 [Limulus polyphemus]|uniref:ABC transporter G family member 21-like isoform X1 n=1 Tax=Limulus polyphemus TaxID=6850 RepID=A0ABM1SUX7_LIMPO|nr:ABC transporter G family member 21-like isoform X1 [Limulus polyphemus]